MDELLSLFGADGTEAEGKSIDEHSKAEGEPSSHCNDFGSSFDAFADHCIVVVVLPQSQNRKQRKATERMNHK